MIRTALKLFSWVLAVGIGLLGLLIRKGVVHIPGLSGRSFWLVFIAFVILALVALIRDR